MGCVSFDRLLLTWIALGDLIDIPQKKKTHFFFFYVQWNNSCFEIFIAQTHVLYTCSIDFFFFYV